MRLVSIGDSFTEGVGDDLPDGTPRGWADLLATGLAVDGGAPVEYANLAIRGRLIGRIVDEQLEPALALGPTVLTFNGGGNDLLRPRADIARICGLTDHVVTRCLEAGVRPVLLSVGNPSRGLPLGRRVQRLGDRLTSAIAALAARRDVPFADNWNDAELARADYWGEDRLHLNAAGHRRVAARALDTLGAAYPPPWMSPGQGGQGGQGGPHAPAGFAQNVVYYRRHVVPWVRRRLTGRSSGDQRLPKHAQLTVISPGPPA